MLAFVIQSVLTYGPMLAFYLCIQGICALRWVNIFPLEHLVVSRLQNKPTPNLLYVHVCLLPLKIFIWLSAYMFFRTSVCVCVVVGLKMPLWEYVATLHEHLALACYPHWL